MPELNPTAFLALCKLQTAQHAVGGSVYMALPCHTNIASCTL